MSRDTINKNKYLESLDERSKNKRVSKNHQLIGLEIADLLEDRAHKALYIKLAKQQNEQKLRTLAKNVAERKNIKNKGAYFMRVLYAKDE
ncbi:MAG: hypothetical protein AB1333_04365 [Patescibacteria group bacterium]